MILLSGNLITNTQQGVQNMRLNDFGKEVRTLRIKFNVSLKAQAESMGISSAHLSALEYGDKRLNAAHIKAALQFFKELGATDIELNSIQSAADRSLESVEISSLDSDAKELVVAFARSLQEGGQLSDDIIKYLSKK